MRKFFVGALLCALLAPWAASAQEQRGTIEGTVRDQQGGVLPGASVELAGAALIATQTAVTDDRGLYRFLAVPPGQYVVTVTMPGFTSAKSDTVFLSVGLTLRVDLGLSLQGVAETVQVRAESPAIDVASSRTATTINAETFAEIPKGRTFNTVLQMAPGVRSETKSGSAGVGGYQVDGASGSENVFTLDGVDVSNVRRGSLGESDAVPFEFIQEVQVKSGGLDADYGGAMGGVVNVISKAGSDTFRGEANYFYRGSALDSAPRPGYRRLPTDATQAQLFQPPDDDIIRNYPGFTLGGPIFKERLRFFVGYAHESTDTDRSHTYVGNGITKESSQTVTQNRGFGRLDYSPAQSIQMNASYFWNPSRTRGGLLPNDPLVAPSASDLTVQGGFTPSNATSVAFNYIPTSKLLFSARYGYKYLNDKGGAYGKDDSPYLIWQRAYNNGDTPPVPPAYQQAQGYSNVSNTFLTQFDRTTRHNLYLDATWFATIAGQNHQIKGGYMLNRVANEVLNDYIDGRFDVYWGEGYTRGSINNARGPYGYYIWEDGVKLNAQVSGRNQGFYVMDSWQVHPRLTANLGIRFETEYLPPYAKEWEGKAIPNPIEFGWGDKIAPRLGVAWDVRGDGRWKVSSSWGIYNDVLKYEVARGSFGGDYWHSRVYTLNSPDLSKLSASTPASLGSLIIDIDNRTLPINPTTGQLEGIDPDIKPMSHWAFEVTNEYQFAPRDTLVVRYSHKDLRKGIEDIGVLDEFENEQYVTGNPGYGMTSDTGAIGGTTHLGASLVPKAVRDYDAVEVRVTGRRTKFFYSASYTWSRLWGNWAGLANSDENGRSDPNVSRAFDLSPGNFDAKGNNVYGLLATDRPHTLKLFGSYNLDWWGTTTVGLSQIAYSGTPLSSEVTYIVPVFYNGRGDMGRTDALTQTDLFLSHNIPLGGRMSLQLEASIINLFDQDAVTNRVTRINRNGSLSDVEALYDGTVNVVGSINPNGINPATGRVYPSPNLNPIYGLPGASPSTGGASGFQGGRTALLGARLRF
jgi:hypothetical protein